jgi:hypothetical protein
MSDLDEVLKRTNTVEKKEILVDLIDAGMGVEPDDLMLKVPGLANHFRGIAQALETMAKSIPTTAYQQTGERLDRYESMLSERITLHETMLSQTLEKIETVLSGRTKLDETMLSQTLKQVETLLAEQETRATHTLDRIEQAKIKAYIPPKNKFSLSGFSPMSGAVCAIPVLLVVGVVSWFYFIPTEVARQRSVDRQIDRYLQSPEGKAFLKFYQLKSCKSNCK